MVALLVAPVLAIVAYFAVDYMVTETPHKAKAGGSYALVNKPNCRYASGKCELVNGDMKIRLALVARQQQYVTISISSDIPLQQVLMSSDLEQNALQKPTQAEAQDQAGKQWQITLLHTNPKQQLRLAVVAQESKYFSQVSSAFLQQ